MERIARKRARAALEGALAALAVAAAGAVGVARAQESPSPAGASSPTPSATEEARARTRADAQLVAGFADDLRDLRRLGELGADVAASVDVRLLAERIRSGVQASSDELLATGQRRGWDLAPFRAAASNTRRGERERGDEDRVAELRRLGPRAFNVPFLSALEAKLDDLRKRLETTELNASDPELRAWIGAQRVKVDAHAASTKALLKLFKGPAPLVPSTW